MANCDPCKSKLGTGANRRTTVTRISTIETTNANRVGELSARLATGGPMGEHSTGLYQINAQPGSSYKTITLAGAAVRQVISAWTWVSAVSTVHAAPDAYPWALYTGGKYALLYTSGGVIKKRRVLAVRNAGPTGLEVRLGHIVAASVGFGTGGCGDRRGLPGTGGKSAAGETLNISSLGTGADLPVRRPTYPPKSGTGALPKQTPTGGLWLPAYSNQHNLPIGQGFAFAYYPGKSKARVYFPGKPAKWRTVIGTRQGGSTGVEVRVHALPVDTVDDMTQMQTDQNMITRSPALFPFRSPRIARRRISY